MERENSEKIVERVQKEIRETENILRHGPTIFIRFTFAFIRQMID